MFDRIIKTSDFIKDKMGQASPKVGIVLGSGLGDFADKIQDSIEIPYDEIPNFPKTTVKGHKGRLVIGKVQNTQVAVFQGRFHFYEGYQLEDVILPVRVLKYIGVNNLILTNAAGGINSNYIPGDLVYLTDHLNLTGNSPLIGPNDERLGVRFPDMTEAYNPQLNQLLKQTADELSIDLKSGVYAGVLGPAYETPAEINMLHIMGADMVGMSTVPEVIAANHINLKVCAISCITNLAAGIGHEKLSHDDVKEVANMAMNKFTLLIEKVVKKMEALT
ncbi:MAG: purine-nucleoside phosphorylase [Halobacteriovoraceae bacterium]|jgi:purine-nucleoside phosphorylase|nr:purine-nucleoside phosphorylase [Halobacteriovoraceae bacterium]